MMNEASVIMDIAKAKEKEVEDRILNDKECYGKSMMKERRFSSRQIDQMKSKHDVSMKKLHDEHKAVLRVNGKKYDMEKVRIVYTSYVKLLSILTSFTLQCASYHYITGEVEDEVGIMPRQVGQG